MRSARSVGKRSSGDGRRKGRRDDQSSPDNAYKAKRKLVVLGTPEKPAVI